MILFKRTVGNLLRALNLKQINPSLCGAPLIDHVIKIDGQLIGVEVSQGFSSEREITQIVRDLRKANPRIDKFIFVTPNDSPKHDIDRFSSMFNEMVKGCEFLWCTGEEFQDFLGIGDKLDLSSLHNQSILRTNAVARPLEYAITYQKHGRASRPQTSSDVSHIDFEDMTTRSKEFLTGLPNHILALRRNLSTRRLARILLEESDNFDEFFRVGSTDEDVYVCLTDIKNSSALSSVARSDDLNNVMYEYYHKSRELAWSMDGYLDKFMGDGVACLFSYPQFASGNPLNAVLFGKAIIDLGRSLFDGLMRDVNANIETGTRVGIANGSLRVMDLGYTEAQLSFVGDTYNLAARIEKGCEVDGVLLDQRTYTRLLDFNPDIEDKLDISSRVLDLEAVKGQQLPIKTWQISSDSLRSLPRNILEVVSD